ncbi:MAG: (d)CMP kinase, partial [Alphaproteobacteria bacterium]|nr:(d)CMP kinase [Alphaproteobacteria bacterium]
MKPFIITIDGPSGVGKGTLATSLAEALNFIHLDTGAQYRAVTLAFLQSKKSFNEQTLIAIAENLTPEKLLPLIQDPQLRAPETSQLVSKVAHIKSVRVALTKLSQEFCLNPPQNAKGVVLDGRDTGTLVYPQANIKFFLTAESKVRAKRRWLDYQQKGIQRDFEEVFKE